MRLQKAGKMSKKHEDKKVQDKESEELKNLENQLKRALADYQNLEKRIAEEKASWIKLANKTLLLKLLPGLDSLLLAQKHTEDEGIKLSVKHFLDILEGEGVLRIETLDKDFDPNLMEAVSTTSGQEGKVVEEVRSGYTLNGQILRPAQVVVGKEEN